MKCPCCQAPISMSEIKQAARPEVIDLRSQGLSVRAIKRETGLALATIKSYCAEAGLGDIGLRPGPKPASAPLGQERS